jgi:hypothetical protein
LKGLPLTRPVLIAASTSAVAVLTSLAFLTVARADHSASLSGLLAIDAGVQGNTATVLGSIDGCSRIESGGQIDVDYVVDAVPDDRPLIGFELVLQYNPDLIEVVEVDYDLLLAAVGSYQPFSGGGLTDELPDSDGSYRLAVLDTASQTGDPQGGVPEANVERGPGVLARFTLLAKGTGMSPLEIGYDPAEHLYPLTMDTQNEIVLADKIGSASVAVGQDCPPEAIPPNIVDTPNTEEELFGGTPPPDAPSPAGGTDANAATDGQAPGPNGQTGEGQTDGPAQPDGVKLVPCPTNVPPQNETPAAGTAGAESSGESCTPTPSPAQQAHVDVADDSNAGLFGGAAALLGITTAAAGGGWYIFRRSRNGDH